MAYSRLLSQAYSHQSFDLASLQKHAESLHFIVTLIHDLAEALQQQELVMDDETFLAMQELNVEVIDIAEHLLVLFNSAYLSDEVKRNIDLSGLKVWVHGFSNCAEDMPKQQRIIALKSLIDKMAKTNPVLSQHIDSSQLRH